MEIDPNSDAPGQCVAIIALGGGYLPSDLQQAADANWHKPPAVADCAVNGMGNIFGFDPRADQELALDIQVLAALVHSARIAVYFAANNEDSLTAALRKAVADNEASVVSISWGSAESLWPEGMRAAAQSALEDAAKRKVTVVAAAGDKLATSDMADGAPHVLYPASSRWSSPVAEPRSPSMPRAARSRTSSYGTP